MQDEIAHDSRIMSEREITQFILVGVLIKLASIVVRERERRRKERVK